MKFEMMNFYTMCSLFFQEHYLLMRLTSCFLLGMWWCISGSLLQWTTQNPLSCPVTLGMTALPVCLWLLCYVLGLDAEKFGVYGPLIIIVSVIHYVYARKIQKNAAWKIFDRDYVIIMGVALNLSLASFYSLLYFYHSSQGKVMPNALWFGLLKNMETSKFLTLLVGSIVFFLILKTLLKDLSLFSLGKKFASNFIDVSLVERKILIFNSALMCLIIFTGGVFAFWGLLLPHLMRSVGFLRNSLSKEIFGGGVGAGLMMMGADYLCYEYPLAGSEFPVGLISSILGPVLLVLLLIKKNSKAVKIL